MLSRASASKAKSADSHRRAQFKKTVSGEDGRRKRNDSVIQIRKAKRMESLRKRRAMTTRKAGADAVGGLTALANAAPAAGADATVGQLATYKADIMSADAERQYQGTRNVRRLLSRESDPPVEAVMSAGLLPRFMDFLNLDAQPKLQFEAAWALTNVASTEHTSVVVDLGVTPILARLLRSPNPDVREQSLWCLGNIAGDSCAYRDMILETPGALANLLLNITHPQHTSMLRNATWALSNFARGKPAVPVHLMQPAIPVLTTLLASTDAEVLTDACWTLSYLSDGEDSRIQHVVDAGAVPALVRLLAHANDTVVTPALRTIGNIVSGSDVQTSAVVEGGALGPLVTLLQSSRQSIRKEACWALSNVAAGTRTQVNALFQTNNAVVYLMQKLANDAWAVQKEATWALCNLISSANGTQIHGLVQFGAIEALVRSLDKQDAKVVSVCLDSLGCILRIGQAEETEEFCDKVEEAGGLDLLEDLQDHANDEVYQKAASLITTYFDSETVADVEIAPQVVADATGAETFGFGVPGGDSNPFASVAAADGMEDDFTFAAVE